MTVALRPKDRLRPGRRGHAVAPPASSLTPQLPWARRQSVFGSVRSIAERAARDVLAKPVQNLLNYRDDLRGVFEPHIKDKLQRVNLCYSPVDKSMGRVSAYVSREQAVVEIFDRPQRY